MNIRVGGCNLKQETYIRVSMTATPTPHPLTAIPRPSGMGALAHVDHRPSGARGASLVFPIASSGPIAEGKGAARVEVKASYAVKAISKPGALRRGPPRRMGFVPSEVVMLMNFLRPSGLSADRIGKTRDSCESPRPPDLGS